MSPRPLTPLPPELMGRPFSVREARALGVSRDRLSRGDVARPAFGARSPWPPQTLLQATGALAVVLEGPWAWSHETAAELLELPVIRGWTPGQRLHVMRPTSCGLVRRPGVRGRTGLERRSIVQVRGMPVVDPFATWCDLASTLPLTEAVILGDAIAARGASTGDRLAGFTPLRALADQAAKRVGTRGAPRIRAALALVREGSWSPMETRARLSFVEAGLPEPELNVEVHDDGRWVTTVDFLWRQQRVIVEYQGDHHRTDRARWRADLQRLGVLQDLGWRVILMTAADLDTPGDRADFRARIRRALAMVS